MPCSGRNILPTFFLQEVLKATMKMDLGKAACGSAFNFICNYSYKLKQKVELCSGRESTIFCSNLFIRGFRK